MAGEDIFDALVRVRVDDGNAISEVAGIVEAVKAEFVQLANLPGVDVGRDLVKGLGPATQDLGELLHQLRRILETGSQMQGAFRGDLGFQDQLNQVNRLIDGTQRLLDLTRQIEAHQSRGPLSQGPIVAEREERRRQELLESQLGQLPPGQASFVRAGLGQGANLEDILKALGIQKLPDAPNTLRSEQFQSVIAEIEDRIRRADPGDATDYSELRQKQATFVAAEERLFSAQAAVQEQKLGADKQYAAAVAGHQRAGIALLKELNRLKDFEVDSEKQAAAAVQERAEAERVAASPRRALLQGSNEDYLKSRGIDLDESQQSARLQLQLQENAAQTAVVAARAKEAVTVAELEELEAKKVRLAAQELQLKRQIVESQAREARVSRGDGGFLGGVFGRNQDDDGFGQGFAFQAGITLKYYAFYAAFAAGQRILEGILATTRDYTLAVNQLSIALGVNQQEADEAARSYAAIGAQFANDPLQSTNAAVKYLRSFRDDQGRVAAGAGETGARVGGIVNVLEPGDHAEDTLQDLIAITKAYQQNAQASEVLYDKILAVAQFYGYESAGEVLPGVAAVGDIGRQSGYTPEQLAALIASVMRDTGVGADAAAGDIKRFLGSQNDPGLLRIFDQYGINQDQTLYQKLDQLSVALAGRTDEERSRIFTSVGGPRIAAAVAAALSGIEESKVAAASVQDPERLTAADQARQRLAQFGGQLEKFAAEVQNLFVQIGRAGVLDLLGALVALGTGFIDVLGRVLGVFADMPPVLRDVIVAVLALMAISRAQAFFQGSGAAAGAAGAAAAGAGSRLLLNGSPLFATQAAQQAQVARSLALITGAAAPAAVASTTLAGRITALGASLGAAAIGAARIAAALLPMLTIGAGIYAISDANQSAEGQEGAAKTILANAQALRAALAKKDSAGAQAAMAGLRGGQGSLHTAADTFGGVLIDVLSDADVARDGLNAKVDQLIAQAKAEVARIEAAEKALDERSPTSEFFGKNYNNVTRGVSLIESKGLSATRVTSIVDDLLRQDPLVVAGAVQPGEGQKGLPELVAYLTKRLGADGSPAATQAGYAELHRVLQQASTRARAAGDDTQVEALRQQLDEVDKAWAAAILAQTRARVEALKRNYTGDESAAEIKALLTQSLNDLAQTGDVNALVQLMNGLDRAFIDEYIANLNAQEEALTAQRRALEDAAQAAAERAASSSDYGPNAGEGLRAEMRARAAAQQVAGPDLEHARFNEISNAVKEAAQLSSPTGSDTTQLASALQIAKIGAGAVAGNSLSQATATLRQAQVRLAQETAGTAAYYDALKALHDAQRGLADAQLAYRDAVRQAGVTPGDTHEAAVAAVAGARDAVRNAVRGSTEYYVALKQLHDAQRALAENEHAAAAAVRSAKEIPGDPLSAARIAIEQARSDLKFAVDTQQYYAALKSLRQAQYDLARIELEMANNRTLLSIDITDPVAMARARVLEAQRQLQYDRARGALPDVLLQDEVALRQAKSDAEGAAWSQQFQDMRTNYDLQRVSLSSYLSYLRAQHDYLTAVKDKTRQQIDQLNQVDQALKGLTEGLQGQWNLGEIRVPTPYEMRRQAAGGFGAQPVSYVTINLTNASRTDFEEILEQYVGVPIMQTAATIPSKVP